MMRTASVRSMYITASKRRRSEMPSNTNRSSMAEWRESATILPNGSPKTVAASSNDTPCLARFPAALRGSHSNSSANPHYTCGSKMVLRHRSVASFTGNCPHCPTAGRLDNWIGTDKPASHPERRFTPTVSFAGSGLHLKTCGRHRVPDIFTTGPETLPGSSLLRLSMSRSNVPVCESAPQSSSAFAEPE